MSKYGNKSCIDRFVMHFFRLIMYLCNIKNNEQDVQKIIPHKFVFVHKSCCQLPRRQCHQGAWLSRRAVE